MSRYTFDLSAYGEQDLATLQILLQQQAWSAIFRHIARFATFDVGDVPVGELKTMSLAFCAALQAHVARQRQRPDPEEE